MDRGRKKHWRQPDHSRQDNGSMNKAKLSRRDRGPDLKKPANQNSKASGWDHVAGWYDKMVGVDGSDYHRNVILPAALDLLNLQSGESVIDVCCGQGVLFPHLLKAGAERIIGVDASQQLVDRAQRRFPAESRIEVICKDACIRDDWADGSFDAAVCLMAVHDVGKLPGLLENLASSLKQNGRVVAIMMHPCFRIPKQSHWGWDGDQKVQYRRIDKYGNSLQIGIETQPSNGSGEGTVFYHRPLQELLTGFGNAGIGIIECKELYSHRRSQGGPFSKAEHRAAEEFPLFLGLKGMKQKAY